MVVDGVMYITGPNEAYALDATTGRQIWSFRTPRTPGLLSEAGGGANRGVALSGNRVFMITDNAHLLALDRTTGRKLWDVTMADTKEGYSATAAPLAIGDLVISGISGGEEGARGFVDAYRAADRRACLALLDHPGCPARKARKPGSETPSNTVAAPPGSPVPTTRPSGCFTGPWAIPAPTSTAMSARATTCTPTA